MDFCNNLNAAGMFLLKGLMTHHCLFAIINLVPIGDLCFFVIQHSVGRTFIFSGIGIEKCCLISLTVLITY